MASALPRVAAKKVAGAKKFPTDKIILSVGNGKGNRDPYNEILPRFTVSGHKEKGRSCGRIDLQPPVTHRYVYFRRASARNALRRGRNRSDFLDWQSRDLRCLSPYTPLRHRGCGVRTPFGRFRPC